MFQKRIKNVIDREWLWVTILRMAPSISRFRWVKYRPYDTSLWERFYGSSDDPFKLSTGEGEDRKYAFTLALCGDGPFRRALEIGCSHGLFTAMLAPRCESLLAVDISETAVERARGRTADFPQVTCRQLLIPKEMPAGSFDLIVCSDVLYYWPPEDLSASLPVIANLLEPDGRFVVLHYLGDSITMSSGAVVHDMLRHSLPLAHIKGGEQDFRLNGAPSWRYDVFEQSSRSVNGLTP